MPPVALRKESVDRNQYLSGVMTFGPGSLSARRAWIEIKKNPLRIKLLTSLSARRAWIEIGWWLWLRGPCWGRSPQGERG